MLLLKPQGGQKIILIKLFTNHMILEGVLLIAFLGRNVVTEAITSLSQPIQITAMENTSLVHTAHQSLRNISNLAVITRPSATKQIQVQSHNRIQFLVHPCQQFDPIRSYDIYSHKFYEQRFVTFVSRKKDLSLVRTSQFE